MHFARLAALVTAALGATAAIAAGTPYAHLTWRSVGPASGGGRVAAVAGTASDPNLYYIGSAGGGVWKTVNGGATWTAVFEKELVAAIGAVTIDPTNENVVWVGTGEANPRNDATFGDGVYKTTDGGKTWTNVGLRDTWSISRILVDPHDPLHVVVGAFGDPFRNSEARGVYVTEDGGKTWSKTLYVGPQTGAAELAMDPNDPSVIYASMWQFRRLPWTFHSGGPDDGIWRSTDGGKTWTRLAGHGLPSGLTGRSAVAIAPSDSKRVYAIIEAKGGILWRSDDGGQNWTMVSSDTLVDQRPFYFTHLAVDPRDENRVYAVSMMLALSKDGGKKFAAIAQGVHVDYHAIWIAPNDPNRIIVGEDGGYAITLDGGAHWSFSRNIPIGEVYHVGLSLHQNPYWVCAPLQDNNGFCAPENSQSPGGIANADWQDVIGGDGEWAVPDPSDPSHVLADLETGRIVDYDTHARTSRFVVPYYDFSRNAFALYDARYRFNWDAPIAFAPWNGHVAWLGANVVFQTMDRGVHWTPISPDLTLNDKAHQQPAGGPITLDVSSAEYSDTLLDIEGSPARRGEIWTGADDGVIAVTTDGGAHWAKHTIAGVPPYCRVETIAPSPFSARTAYANEDCHRSGNYRPYLFVTHDYGRTWTKITNGLPGGVWARTIRPDDRNPDLLFAGTETGLWISYDRGTVWSPFNLNIPTVSIRDIREQPEFNDLAIATHGRDLWILDDIGSLQGLPQAQRAGAMLFAPRVAYEYAFESSGDEGAYTDFRGANPPSGAIVDFYQAAPQPHAPSMEILDGAGHVIRHILPQRKPAKTGPFNPYAGPGAGPGVTNDAGINRVVWNFREDGPPLCTVCAKEFRGSPVGALVLPGRYVARITLNGRTYSQAFVVRADPHHPYTLAQLRAGYAFARRYGMVSGKINTVIDRLAAQQRSLEASYAALVAKNAALAARVTAALHEDRAIFHAFTADYHNDEDSIQRPGALKEDVPRAGFGPSQPPPTPALLSYARRFDVEYRAAMARYDAYVRSLGALSVALRSAGAQPVAGATPVSP
ncbi:MAG: WD40/YVTN/BNR-like repeat-containing protein [Candidatus Tyrphobacter sp.]